MSGALDLDSFDLIFSSSLIEHLFDKGKFLQDTRKILSSNGHAIHIVPSRMFKVTHLLLFYLNLFLLIIDRLIGIFQKKPIFRGAANNFENNINSNKTNKINKWRRLLLPRIHGNYKTHIEEWRSWSKNSWQKLFKDNGYLVVNYIKGPAFSGYGFGWNHLREALERFGWASEHIFILKKIK